MGVVGEPLASVTDTVFVAAIIGSFSLVGTIVGRVFLKKWYLYFILTYERSIFLIFMIMVNDSKTNYTFLYIPSNQYISIFLKLEYSFSW